MGAYAFNISGITKIIIPKGVIRLRIRRFFDGYTHNTRTKVPIVISNPPIIDFVFMVSPKIKNAKTILITTLNLSIGTTFEASPIWSAL